MTSESSQTGLEACPWAPCWRTPTESSPVTWQTTRKSTPGEGESPCPAGTSTPFSPLPLQGSFQPFPENVSGRTVEGGDSVIKGGFSPLAADSGCLVPLVGGGAFTLVRCEAPGSLRGRLAKLSRDPRVDVSLSGLPRVLPRAFVQLRGCLDPLWLEF